MQNPNYEKTTQIYALPPEPISLHLWLRYVLDGYELEKDWRWKLHIVVDEMTTANELSIYPKIMLSKICEQAI